MIEFRDESLSEEDLDLQSLTDDGRPSQVFPAVLCLLLSGFPSYGLTAVPSGLRMGSQ
jgi:hypothetical protein